MLERIIEDALATFGGRAHGAFRDIGYEKGEDGKDSKSGEPRCHARSEILFEVLAGSTHWPAIWNRVG